MVERAGECHGASFQGFRGVTQGEPLPLPILNVVVDTVVSHWILFVEGGAGRQYGWGREVIHSDAFFYADNRLVASTDPVWLQGVFDTLIRLFDRVGIWKNLWKTVGMLCLPYRAVGDQ